MHLLRLDDSMESRWDEYVEQRTSTVTDLSGWRHVVRNAYGIKSHFIAVEENGALIGTLGLYEFQHPLFGHYLTTAAFSTDGGLHYDTNIACDLLMDEAKRLADELRVSYLLIRTRGLPIKGYTHDRRFRTAVLDLRSGADMVWLKTLPAKTRNQVRRGSKEGFTVHTVHDQLPDFHRVFHTHMRDLVHCPESSRRYFGRLFADSFVALPRKTPGLPASRASLSTKIHPELTPRTSRTVH